ncbi:MAG: hypothetical protein KF716_22820 [Anaerolineae bacterium]|nr:hypothetical protein [Anaerolineae bacterium]
MTIQLVIFVIFVFTTFFHNGAQAYIHLEAYPLLAYVGRAEFPTYLKEYEQRLTLPLLVAYGVMLLCNLILIATQPPTMPVAWLIVALIINMAVSAVTAVVATPVYNRIKETGQAVGGDMEALMRINSLRLLLSSLSSLIVIYLLLDLLIV